MELIKAQKGTKDLLPDQSEKWRAVEDVMRSEAQTCGFGEIRTPVFEDTRLFQRSVGETTDVVQKEMYTFSDKGGRSVTLKPEGTAGAVRAFLEHGLFNGALPERLYYFTPCYRYENTQAGRLREFHQFGVEMFGTASPFADAEVICLAHGIFQRLGLRNLRLEINSIGCPDCRARYNDALRAYFTARKDRLCETCLTRLERNPMRILDCKNPECAEIAKGAPHILDYLCDDCRAHFEQVKTCLEAADVPYLVNPTIVRGLDYYTRTVFEFIADGLGAQSTLCGGGRYDGLVGEMGGNPTPALGFAVGMERLMMVLDARGTEFPEPETCELYVASIGEKAQEAAFVLVQKMRRCSVAAQCDVSGRSLNAQMKYAGKIGSQYTLVLGDDELQSGKAMVKNMKTGEKTKVDLHGDFAGQFAALGTEQDDLSF